MRLKMLGIAALAVALVALAGCINYDQELTMNPDGSGTVKVRYDRTGGGGGEEGEDSLDMSAAPELSFTEEEIMAEYEGSAVTVRDIVVGKTEEDVPEATYYIDFKKVTDLNGYGIFALEGDKLKQTFSLDASGENMVFKQLVQLKMDVEDPSQLSSYKFTYIFNAPGEVVDSNGTVAGNTVSWEYTLDKLINTDTEMTVTYKAGAAGGGSNVAVIIGIILCVIIIIVIIIVIVVLLGKKKKKKPAAPAAPSEPAA